MSRQICQCPGRGWASWRKRCPHCGLATELAPRRERRAPRKSGPLQEEDIQIVVEAIDALNHLHFVTAQRPHRLDGVDPHSEDYCRWRRMAERWEWHTNQEVFEQATHLESIVKFRLPPLAAQFNRHRRRASLALLRQYAGWRGIDATWARRFRRYDISLAELRQQYEKRGER